MESAMELTAAQAEAMRQSPEGTLDLIDPATGQPFVLISRSTLERLQEDAEDARQILGWERPSELGADLAIQNDR